IRWAVDYEAKRVRPVVVYESEEVLLKDFNILRAGFWTVSLTYSSGIHVDGLVIRNNIGGYGPSSDGINTDSSQDVLVENCDIDCNDDNLCIKSGRDADGLRVNRPAENIVYRNCITRAGHGLFTIGSETSGGMKNIEVYGLEAIGTNTGIRFKSAQVRGGVIENVYFHNIVMKNVKNPFHFELNWYPEYSYPEIPENLPAEMISQRMKTLTQPVFPPERGIPEFKDIHLEDIRITGAEQAIYANAYPEKPIKDLTWENINIEADTYGTIKHASNWQFKNVEISTLSDDSLQIVDGSLINTPGIPVKKVAFEPVQKNAPEINVDLDQIFSKLPFGSMTVLNAANKQPIQAGDATVMTDQLAVFARLDQNKFQFYEPLGDGFYFSEVSIKVGEDHTIEVAGQKDHKWIFKIMVDQIPEQVRGADHWYTSDEQMFVNIIKTGKSFKLAIQ
ncbi:MAG: glycoside hydrolase family 28 protein, partial [Candidatus Cyclobacteriaceae bacterium M3_2C_046]